jgi:hypothetical protein
MANSPTSTKSRPKKQATADEAEQSVATVAEQAHIDDAPIPEEWAADILRAVLAWQIEQIKMKPSKNTKCAIVRARDARTMSELLRTLERLDAVEKRREGKGKKPKSRNDADIKADFIRRLDQLLAARDAGESSAKPQSK